MGQSSNIDIFGNSAVTFLAWLLGPRGALTSQLWRFRITNLYSRMFLCLFDGLSFYLQNDYLGVIDCAVGVFIL